MFWGLSQAEPETDADYKPDSVSPWKVDMELL